MIVSTIHVGHHAADGGARDDLDVVVNAVFSFVGVEVNQHRHGDDVWSDALLKIRDAANSEDRYSVALGAVDVSIANNCNGR